MKNKQPLTHLNEKGEANIVDIADKAPSKRCAIVSAKIKAKEKTIDAIFANGLKKGDAIAVARIAGIMAAKKTADLIPLCHPIALTSVRIDIKRGKNPKIIKILASVETLDRTGVEMEAMSAASVTALTLYDMAKSMDRSMSICKIELIKKSGGKSGIYLKKNKND